jgi:hypothetical protein
MKTSYLIFSTFLVCVGALAQAPKVLLYSTTDVSKTTFCKKYRCQKKQAVTASAQEADYTLGNDEHIALTTFKKNAAYTSIMLSYNIALDKNKYATQLEAIREFVVMVSGTSLQKMNFEQACIQMVRPEMLGMGQPNNGTFNDLGLAGVFRRIRYKTSSGWVVVNCGTVLYYGPGWRGISIALPSVYPNQGK